MLNRRFTAFPQQGLAPNIGPKYVSVVKWTSCGPNAGRDFHRTAFNRATIHSSECCRRFVILRSKVEKTSVYAPAARVLELLFRGSPSKVWTSEREYTPSPSHSLQRGVNACSTFVSLYIEFILQAHNLKQVFARSIECKALLDSSSSILQSFRSRRFRGGTL